MDLQTRQDLERIVKLFGQHELKGLQPKLGNVYWVPTPPEILLEEMITLDVWTAIEGKRHEGRTLVAGAGDSRRVAPLARLGYDVVAIELNPRLVQHGNYMMDLLAQHGLVDRTKVTIVEGDFLDDNTYISRDLAFSDFNKIFAYLKPENLAKLADKIRQQSYEGTELFILRFMEWNIPDMPLRFRIRRKIEWGPNEEIKFPAHYDVLKYVRD